jgi:mRNA interferase MazF
MTEMIEPLRGEIWLVDLDPTRGREQAGKRPALVVSANVFNKGPAELVVVLPITSKAKGIPLHVRIDPPEGGVKTPSFIKCEDVRSVAKQRLSKRWGGVSPATMHAVEDRIRILFEV